MSVAHEYVVVYARSISDFQRNLLSRTPEQIAIYKNPDNDPRGDWTRGSLIRREGDYDYGVRRPDGSIARPPRGSSWRVAPATMERLRAENRLWWGKDGTGEIPFAKKFLSEVAAGVVPTTWWDYKTAGSTRNAKAELKALFPDGAPFDTPKPTRLLERLLAVCAGPQSTILDFFAGSGTLAHAVLSLNRQDGGTRRFVLVQLPEKTNRGDYKTISEITRQRVRNVGRQINDAEAETLNLANVINQDRGFRAFKLDVSNFLPWEGRESHEAATLSHQLDLHVDHIRADRSDEDIFFEILLKSGYALTTPVDVMTLAGKQVRSVRDASGSTMLICLDRKLTRDVIREMAEQKPERIVCLDAGFGADDELKANAVQTFRAKGVVSFKTV